MKGSHKTIIWMISLALVYIFGMSVFLRLDKIYGEDAFALILENGIILMAVESILLVLYAEVSDEEYRASREQICKEQGFQFWHETRDYLILEKIVDGKLIQNYSIMPEAKNNG